MYGFVMLFIKMCVCLIDAFIDLSDTCDIASKSAILLLFAHKCFVNVDSVLVFTGKGQRFAVLCHHYTRHA